MGTWRWYDKLATKIRGKGDSLSYHLQIIGRHSVQTWGREILQINISSAGFLFLQLPMILFSILGQTAII